MREPPSEYVEESADGYDAPNAHEHPGTHAPADTDDEVSVLELMVVLAKHKLLVLGLPLVAAVIAAIYTAFLPSIYTATTKILPPQQNQSIGPNVLAQLSGLGGLANRSNNDLYVGMLKSRTVADNLIQRFDLMASSGAKYVSDVRASLAGATNIQSGKDGIITIEVENPDRKRAAELANAYVDELLKLTQVLAVTEAGKRRLFFERQFTQAKDNLAKAEVQARRALQQGGLVKVDDQGRAMVETTARLRGQMAVKEVQIGAMRTFAAESNPELRVAEQELDAMRRELAKIEGTSTVKALEGAVPGKGLENLRLLRDLKYYETVYELLAKQFEVAKIDEAKDSAVVQVLDAAVEPEFKSKPNRRNIVLFSALGALLVAVLWAFMREILSRTTRDPRQVARLQAIRDHLSWRRSARSRHAS